MSICNAFRKSDFQPCKNHARHHHTTCSSHKHFYNKEQWKRMFFSLDSPYLPTGVGYEQTTLVGRIEAAIQYSLTNDLIVLTPADCAGIPCPPPERFHLLQAPTAVDLWTILVSTGKVNPKWNENLTKFTLFHFARMRTPAVLDVAPSLEIRLGPFLKHPAMSPHKLLGYVLSLLYLIIRNRTYSEELKQTSYQTVIDEFTDHPSYKASTFLTDSILTQNISDVPANIMPDEQKQYLKNALLKAVRGKREGFKAFHHNHVEKFKEELVMKVFHPTKVEKWLTEGGFELLDMMF